MKWLHYIDVRYYTLLGDLTYLSYLFMFSGQRSDLDLGDNSRETEWEGTERPEQRPGDVQLRSASAFETDS